jgi:hypothetical protein
LPTRVTGSASSPTATVIASIVRPRMETMLPSSRFSSFDGSSCWCAGCNYHCYSDGISHSGHIDVD